MMQRSFSFNFGAQIITILALLSLDLKSEVEAFVVPSCQNHDVVLKNKRSTSLHAGMGFGSSSSSEKGNNKKKPKKSRSPSLINALEDNPKDKTSKKKKATNKPFVRKEQDELIEQLAAEASKSIIGQAVASSPSHGTPDADPFWEFLPSLLSAKFSDVTDSELERVAGMVRYAVNPCIENLEDDIINDPYRPHDEIHAYMPGLGPTKPFHDPDTLPLCKKLSDNYDTIQKEYEALINDMNSGSGEDRFQSVTSMNYESGWKTLVLFYNGHRIPNFPYHLCPTTTEIMESVPLAGRIAGFNRQKPNTGIPLHSDGNNMWLTCQMGINVPDDNMAHIRVGPETKNWKDGECLLYDTTYEHETFNEHPSQERVVLHIDFFNTIAMTSKEIEIMQYIYRLREEYMKAEGVTKVGQQIL